ncbi:glutaredoxin family protein [Leptolyngbya sp. FACHB-671]|uniref:glutaredoxin family protein n=1 Tax=unclassified Leptolyngbya TaxID=2650499 RepID=UPI001682EA6B|nr:MULTISPECIES: glutaredoxin family protein [unclassified Leptolyngbya]MBD1996719.1 glutaredoxin family protein [Leptolyngbya sp. FACHB-541]MBD2069931.1 glutaredoxin family protein [Leptolyngbya sp. FACHB-671]
MRLILYSKPGCHLCEGLEEKLGQIQTLQFELEVRDITTRKDWFEAFQYEIPVLFLEATSNPQSPIPLPRLSPRATIAQVEQMLQKYGVGNSSE